MRNATATVVIAAAALGSIAHANAAVKISSGATKNITCTGGVCTPTGGAVLNVTQLETMLASGNVTVNTIPSRQNSDITVDHAITWASSSTLTLSAHDNITVNYPISVTGSGGLTLFYEARPGGSIGLLSFGPHGYVTFMDTNSPLFINGSSYTLVDSISMLASDIAANSNGDFALASSYDATPDGTSPRHPCRPYSPEFLKAWETRYRI